MITNAPLQTKTIVHTPSFELRHAHTTHGDRLQYVSLSRTVSRTVLAKVRDRFLERYQLPEYQTVCFLGVASSGYTLASALCEGAGSQLGEDRVYYSGIDLKRPLYFPESWLAPLRNMHVIIVDNSIESGQTARRMLATLEEHTIKAVAFVKVIDYEDVLEQTTIAALHKEFDIDFVSLFSANEILNTFQYREVKLEIPGCI